MMSLIIHEITQSSMSSSIQGYVGRYRFSDLRLSMYVPKAGDFPCLKGKGAEIKHFAAALHHTCSTLMDEGDEIHMQVKFLLLLVATMEAILDEHRDCYILPPLAQEQFEKCTQVFYQLNTALRGHLGSEQMLFHHTIKQHYVLHLGLISRYINPGFGLCYKGEDMVHRVRNIVRSNYHGAAPHLVVDKTMRKYAVGLPMHLSNSTRR